jgi:hypothetical protein
MQNINTRPLTVSDFFAYDATNEKTYASVEVKPQQENLD